MLTIVLQQDCPYGVRQLAAVVLKKHIREHWTFESPHFREPPVEDGEKSRIRELLPNGLNDSNSKLRTAVAMAIAGIAKWDCPQAWPALLPGLLHAITEKRDVNLVNGAVRCLSMFVDELGEEQVLQITPTLLPELLLLVRHEGYGQQLQRRALSILHCLLGVLHMMAGSHLGEVKAMVAGLAADWFPEFAKILATPLGAQDVGGWGVKMECLRVMVLLVSSFSKLCAPHLPAALQLAWQQYGGALPQYQALAVEGEEEEAADVDSEGGSIDLESLLSQLMEFLLTIVGNRRYQATVRSSMAELQYITLGYMQMTRAQELLWGEDPNLYVAQEDDFSSVRATGEMLLDELCEAFEGEALEAFWGAAQRRLQEAAASKASGSPGWWKVREAALLAVGALADRVVESQQAQQRRSAARAQQQRRQQLDAPALLESLLGEDLGPEVPPFLVGRALWVISRMEGIIPLARRGTFLHAAVSRLAPGNPTAVQIGACKAAAQLCRGVASQELQAASQHLYAGLCQLLQQSEEDVLHLVMETLTEVVKADPGGAAQWEPHISPPVLEVWVAHVNDPLLSEDAADLLAALAAIPHCLPSMQSRMLPTLGAILSSPAPSSPLLLSGSVSMITLLLTPSPPDVAQHIHAAATPLVLNLAMTSQEADVLQAATAYLRTLLQVGGAATLSWGGASPSASLASILQPVQRLLGTEMGDQAALQVGGLILELLRYAGDLMAPSLPALLTALAQKLAAADDSSLVQSLVMVVATLVHSSPGSTVDCLAASNLPDGRSALSAVMAKWVERQIEVRTPYAIKLTTTALATLLDSQHPALQQLQVRGKRVDSGGGIRTRARARTQSEEWSSVALPVKIAMLLTDAYIEATTQGEGEDDDGAYDEDEGSEGSWEEAGSEEEEGSGGGEGMPLLGIDALLARAADAEGLAEVDPLEAQRRERDPLSQLVLGPFLLQWFRRLAAQQPAVLQGLEVQLTPTQAFALQGVFAGV